jgi:hypothetical protein
MAQYLVLDIHCQPCRPGWRDGDPNPPPRLARFVRDVRGGPIQAQSFTYKGQPVIPLRRQRPDGGVTWQTRCPRQPYGHNKPIQEWRIVAAFDAFPPGTDSVRIPL